MMNDNARYLILGATGLVIGFCAGIGTGLLFAPDSGARTRRHLKSFADDMAKDTAEAVDKVIEQGKRFIAV